MEHVNLTIDHMHCASCVAKIEGALSAVDGIESISVNFANETAAIDYDSTKISEEEICAAIDNLGYKGRKKSESKEEKTPFFSLKVRMMGSILLSAPLILPMLGFEISPWIQFVLASIVQFVGGYPFYRNSLVALKGGSASMDVLVALGTTSAWGFSTVALFTGFTPHLYFETSSVLISLILVGRYIEDMSKNRARSGMRSLLKMQANTARVKKGSESRDVPIEEVKKGDIVVVKPSERIPVDGKVVQGRSEVVESMLTGESNPIFKEVGNKVFAGTINGQGLLEIEATGVGEETTLGHIIRIVEEAQSSKAPIQRLADLISSYFVPAVLVMSVITFLTWLILGEGREGLISAVAVLVIACPCALGLATPTVIMVATGSGAKRGILFKKAEAIEQARKLEALLIDKTGTITEGKLSVERSEIDESMRPIAKALAHRSEHIASLAVAKSLGPIDDLPVDDFLSIPGKGVQGKVGGTLYFLGSAALMKEQGIEVREGEMTSVFLGADHTLKGAFFLSDRLREGSKSALEELQKMGIKTYLLSGDHETIVKKVAENLAFDGVFGSVAPEQKADYVKKMQEKGFLTGMVGDGVNDSPALAMADVGFAISSGTDVAMESASVGLMKSDLWNLIDAVKLSKKAARKINQNLFFALIYNVLGIPLAAFGLLNPMIAGAAMALSSISVVCNALTLSKSFGRIRS